MTAAENLARRLADAARAAAERHPEPLRRASDVPYIDEAGRIWCNQPVEVDPCGTVLTRCRRQLWSLIEQTSGHALPCTADPARESLDDVDFGVFDR